MVNHVFVAGYPREIGGANTELWHTLRLWRRFGLGATLLPTGPTDPPWPARLEAIGCRTIRAWPDRLADVPGLTGGIVVSFCDTRFLRSAGQFRALGCRLVWLGCMNWLFPEERLHYRRYGPFDRHVFQSRYQRDELTPQLARYGFQPSQGRLIAGAMDADLFPFVPRPHAEGKPLVVGRISRADPEKFPPGLWSIVRRIPAPVRMRVLGWSAEVEARLGGPPPDAECLPAGAAPVQGFLASLHGLVQSGGTAVENWPRVGLEAMAAGVPLVVPQQGGWPEMVRHRRTGLLYRATDELVGWVAHLAHHEDFRLELATAARAALVDELAPAERLWTLWRGLLEGLT